ncbi:MAG: class I SAM-dependent methyltransferase [Anaerolineales bacterium]
MESLLGQQIEYYRARASEYDQWFLREGRYDHGLEKNAQWFAEVEEVAAALDAFGPAGSVLELASGTGLWTERLAAHADQITAVDAAPEALALNRSRLARSTGACPVEHVCADIFAWEPAERYDVVFFSFWLSHVPPGRFEDFWGRVARALKPSGRFFLVDSRREQSSTAGNQRLPAEADSTTLRRRLNDGREYEIYKVFYQPASLHRRLERMGWRLAVDQTAMYFIYAHGGWTNAG